MRRAPNLFLLLLLLMLIVTTNFSACNSGAANSKSAVSSESKPNEPDVTFKNLEGQDVPLASLKGKLVVVNFWATWCEPCRVEIPWMIGFQQKYADKGFTVVGVAMDDEGKSVVAPYVQTTKFDVNGQSMTMNYPIVLGNDDIASKFGGLIGFPTTIVISRDGKVQKRYIGLADEADLEKEIKGLL
ncbi:MAG TPA: TlpA disulfide reductase family protein [Candidatus Sulfotelmatobacter sp.]|jgi:thiol-disulfide isomerase/thioredoxin|nr:TlpA disulfide reductase family protein [Candidatus Sulfotelmatobacter sp.]